MSRGPGRGIYLPIADSRIWPRHRLSGEHGESRLLGRSVAQGAVQALSIVDERDVVEEGRPASAWVRTWFRETYAFLSRVCRDSIHT